MWPPHGDKLRRPVFVVHLNGRSGSSAVAGVVHRLGVPMYLRQHVDDNLAPRGSYECEISNHLEYKILNHLAFADDVAQYVHERRRRSARWGIKTSLFPATWRVWVRYTALPFVIFSRRHTEEQTESQHRAFNQAYGHIRELLRERQELLDTYFRETGGPRLDVWYHELLADTGRVVEEIRAFIQSEEDPREAVSFIDPSLQHVKI